jgi:predicted AAA+ superfamily ATPase
MVAETLNCKQLTLDDPQLLDAARNDPVAFVEQYENGTLVIDEVQRCPELLRVVKLSVDRYRRPGRFLLTGSADLLHVAGANESLVGRAETIRLYPFSIGEIGGFQEDFITRLLDDDAIKSMRGTKAERREDYAEYVERGGYPDVVLREKKRRSAYLRNYLAGVFDHDAAVVSNLSHLDKLSKLFSILAATTSGIYVQAAAARTVGIPETSMGGYIKLLKDLWLIHELPAWGRNIAKRVAGKPKYSVADTGIACQVGNLHSTFLSDVTSGEAFGPLLESFVVAELFKQQSWSETDFRLYHFHDRESREADIVVELPNGKIICLEVKASRTISRKDFGTLLYLRELLGERFHLGIVLYTGGEVQGHGDRLCSAPISVVWGA